MDSQLSLSDKKFIENIMDSLESDICRCNRLLSDTYNKSDIDFLKLKKLEVESIDCSNTNKITIEAEHDIKLGVPYWYAYFDDELHKYRAREIIFTKRIIDTALIYGKCHTAIHYATDDKLTLSDKTDWLFESETECIECCNEANAPY